MNAAKATTNEPGQDAIDAVNLGRLFEAQNKFNSETGTLRSVFAKAEQQNMNIPAAKDALKIFRSGKSDEWVEKTERTLAYLKLLGKPVEKEQLDMFQHAPQSAPEDEKAYNEGLAHGRLGITTEGQIPYDPTSPKGQGWLKGFRQGSADHKAVMAMQPDADDDTGAGEEPPDDEEEE